MGYTDADTCAVLGGLSNVIANRDDIKAHGFWTGVGYFGIGAITGTLTAAGAAWAAETIAAQGVALGALVGAGTGGLSGGLSGSLTNGFNNIMRGQSFGKNGWNSFKSGAISGALFGSISGGVEGGIRALEFGKNVWWGSDVKYGRNQWSLFTSEKPWDVLSTEINTIKKYNKDCVPASMTELNDYFGGERNYEYYCKYVDYVVDRGTSISLQEYSDKLSGAFSASKHMGIGVLKNHDFAKNAIESRDVFNFFSSNFIGNEGHADNIRKILYYSDKVVIIMREGGRINIDKYLKSAVVFKVSGLL